MSRYVAYKEWPTLDWEVFKTRYLKYKTFYLKNPKRQMEIWNPMQCVWRIPYSRKMNKQWMKSYLDKSIRYFFKMMGIKYLTSTLSVLSPVVSMVSIDVTLLWSRICECIHWNMIVITVFLCLLAYWVIIDSW